MSSSAAACGPSAGTALRKRSQRAASTASVVSHNERMTYTEDAEDAEDAATAHAWAVLGGRSDLVQHVSFVGAGAVLPSRLPVRELARAGVGVCSLAAAELLALRNRVPVPAVRVNEAAVATAFVSERHLRIDGRAVHGLPGHVGLYGIESPGLTSALAIAETVRDMLDTDRS